MVTEWPLDPAERWAIDPDRRPGMEWNRFVVQAHDPELRVAFMAAGDGTAIDNARAVLCASGPALLAALEGLIENAQPDNWDDDDDPECAEAWRTAWRTMLEAKGLPVPAYLTPEAG